MQKRKSKTNRKKKQRKFPEAPELAGLLRNNLHVFFFSCVSWMARPFLLFIHHVIRCVENWPKNYLRSVKTRATINDQRRSPSVLSHILLRLCPIFFFSSPPSQHNKNCAMEIFALFFLFFSP